MALKNPPFTAIGDYVEVTIPSDFNGTLTAVLGGGVSPVGFSCVVEASADDGVTFETMSLTRPDRSIVAALTNGQSGWTDAPGYSKARLRVTAMTSGTQGARLVWSRG